MVNSANFRTDQIPLTNGICVGNVTNSLLSGVSANAQGLPISPYATYNVVPTASMPDNIAPEQDVLSATTLVLAAGAGVTLVTDPTSPFVGCIKLDCPRALQFVIASTGSPTAANIIIDGYCGFGSYIRRTQEQVNTDTTADQIFYTQKTYAYVKSITVSGGVGASGTVSVGTADILGLPFFVGETENIIAVKYASSLRSTVQLTEDTSIVVMPSGVPATASLVNAGIAIARYQTIGTPGPFSYGTVTDTTFTLTGTEGDTSVVICTLDFSNQCVVALGDTNTPSLITGDPIGKIILSVPSNGSFLLTVTQYLTQIDRLPNNQSITDYIGRDPYNQYS